MIRSPFAPPGPLTGRSRSGPRGARRSSRVAPRRARRGSSRRRGLRRARCRTRLAASSRTSPPASSICRASRLHTPPKSVMPVSSTWSAPTPAAWGSSSRSASDRSPSPARRSREHRSSSSAEPRALGLVDRDHDLPAHFIARSRARDRTRPSKCARRCRAAPCPSPAGSRRRHGARRSCDPTGGSRSRPPSRARRRAHSGCCLLDRPRRSEPDDPRPDHDDLCLLHDGIVACGRPLGSDRRGTFGTGAASACSRRYWPHVGTDPWRPDPPQRPHRTRGARARLRSAPAHPDPGLEPAGRAGPELGQPPHRAPRPGGVLRLP